MKKGDEMNILKWLRGRLMGMGSGKCPVCGTKMKLEWFEPPLWVKDGTRGWRARCPHCGHVQIIWFHGGI